MLLKSDELFIGRTVYVRFKNYTDAYVWGDVVVPVLIEQEFSNFFVGTALPHKNPHGYGDSFPYHVTLNKFDVDSRNITVSSYITE